MKNKTSKLRGIILSFLLILSAVGCASDLKFHVEIDSISSPDAVSKRKYILLPGIKDVKNSDLQFIEYAKYIDKALASKKFVKAKSFEDANVAIFLVYGIGNPQESTFSYALPTWGQTGISSSNTYGSINTFGNTASYSGFTTYTPTYGITGFIPIRGSYITYFRFLILDAVDLDEYKQSQKINQLWQTTVTSTGSSGDLRLIFPIMVAASKPYLGSNTGKRIEISLTEKDSRVVEIKSINE
jgi:hypothetical protein